MPAGGGPGILECDRFNVTQFAASIVLQDFSARKLLDNSPGAPVTHLWPAISDDDILSAFVIIPAIRQRRRRPKKRRRSGVTPSGGGVGAFRGGK